MYKVLFACVCVVIYFPTLDGKRELPSFVKPCKRADPNLGACVKESIENLKPHLEKGIPEMKIPAFEPLHVLKLILNDGSIELVYADVDFKNFNNFELSDAQFDLGQCKLGIQGLHPSLYLNGSYSADGKLLIFELHSKGILKVNFTSVKWTMTLNCNPNTKHNKEYLKFSAVDVKLNIEDMHLHFTELFEGNQQLTDTTNVAFNENRKTLIDDFTPLLNNAIGEVMLGIVKSVFDSFPLDVLLPK